MDIFLCVFHISDDDSADSYGRAQGSHSGVQRAIGYNVGAFAISKGRYVLQKPGGIGNVCNQIQKIQQLRRGEKFYVSSIVVSGPDGREREIEPIEALVI